MLTNGVLVSANQIVDLFMFFLNIIIKYKPNI